MIAKLEVGALNDACLEVALCVCRRNLEVSTDVAESVAHKFQEECLFYVEYLTNHELDPNLLTRAVRYLGEVHAIPPMGADVTWFRHMLTCIVELACPNSVVSRRGAELFVDIEAGISRGRELSASDAPL